jgi:AMP deaminase
VNSIWIIKILECASPEQPSLLQPPSNFAEFVRDEAQLKGISTSGVNKTYCRREIGLLSHAYKIHKLLNQHLEQSSVQDIRTDFYHVAKVDTHVHLAAAMTANHLLDFIRRKYVHFPDEVVMIDKKNDNIKEITLKDVFKKSGIEEISQLTVDSLDVQAESNLFDRFDHFNAKYSKTLNERADPKH